MVQSLSLSSPTGRIYVPGQSLPSTPLLLHIESFASTGIKPSIVSVAAAGGNQVAVVDSKGSIYTCDLDGNRYRRVTTGCPSVHGIYWVPVEGGAVAVLTGKEIRVFQVNGQLLATLKGHRDKVEWLDVNPLRKWVLSQSVDTVIIWDIPTWRRVRTLNTESSKYSLTRFTPDCQSLVVNLKDGALYQLSLSKFSVEKYYRNGGKVHLFCCSSNMQEMYGVTQTDLQIWDTKRPQGPVTSLSLPPAITKVTQISLLNDAKVVLLADNGISYILDLTTDLVIGELRGEKCEIAYFSLSNSRMVYKGTDGNARIVDISLQIQLFLSHSQSHYPLNRTNLQVSLELPSDSKSSSLDSRSQTSEITLQKAGIDYKSASISTKNSDSEVTCQHHLFQNLFQTAKISPEESRINHCKLNQILQHYGEYPEKYRVFIWRFLLQLPNNKEAFEGLYSKGMHPNLRDLHENEGVRGSGRVYAKVERVMSALTYWSPVFSEIDYLPGLLVPMAVTCKGDDLTLFETAMSFCLHWFQHWFEFHPTPPLNYLQSIHNLLQHHCPSLHLHFQHLHCQPKDYIWPGLRQLFTSLIGLQSVVKLIDFLVTDWDKPQLLIFITTAIIVKFKNRLMKMRKSRDICEFFVTPREVNIVKIMEIAFNLYNETPSEVAIVGFDQKIPISQGQYPLFTGYPKFIVEEKQGIRAKILSEEEELAAQVPLTSTDIHSQLTEIQEKERLYHLKREQMSQLEHQFRNISQIEEQIRTQEKLAFHREISEKKQNAMKDLETRFNEEKEKMDLMRETELKQLEKEIKQGEIENQYELEAKITDETLKSMQERVLSTINEQLNGRIEAELRRKEALIRGNYEEKVSLEDKVTQAAWERDDETAKLREMLKKEREIREMERKRLEETAKNVEKQQKMKSLEHELKLLEVEEDRRLRKLAEEELSRNQAFLTLQSQKRSLLSQEENHHFSELKRLESFHEKKLIEERQNLLQNTTLSHRKEIQSQEEELDRLEKVKMRKEAEGKLIELRKESEQKALQGEKEFQEEIMRIDEEMKRKKAENMQKLFEKKEEEERLYFERVLQNETVGRYAVERDGREELVRKLQEQRERTENAQRELEKAHRERVEQEMTLAGRKQTAGKTSGGSSVSSKRELEGNRRAVTFHSNFTSPEYTNRLSSQDESERERSCDCSCSCESESGASTPPLPIRNVQEDEYSELSDGSEMVLSHSGSSFSYSASHSRR